MMPCFVFALGEVEDTHSRKEIDGFWANASELELPIPGLRCIHCGGEVYLAVATRYGARYCLNCTHLSDLEVV